jgi:hypothetical protein
MKLSYTLTLADFKAAQRLHIRQRLSRRINFYFWYMVIPILAIITVITTIVAIGSDRSDLVSDLVAPDALLLWLAIFLPLARVYKIHKGFKQFLHPARTDRINSLDIDDERIVSTIPGVGEGKLFWNAIFAFAQDEKVALLYVREKRFLFFPTTALSSEQRTELNELVKRHLPEGKR